MKKSHRLFALFLSLTLLLAPLSPSLAISNRNYYSAFIDYIDWAKTFGVEIDDSDTLPEVNDYRPSSKFLFATVDWLTITLDKATSDVNQISIYPHPVLQPNGEFIVTLDENRFLALIASIETAGPASLNAVENKKARKAAAEILQVYYDFIDEYGEDMIGTFDEYSLDIETDHAKYYCMNDMIFGGYYLIAKIK